MLRRSSQSVEHGIRRRARRHRIGPDRLRDAVDLGERAVERRLGAERAGFVGHHGLKIDDQRGRISRQLCGAPLQQIERGRAARGVHLCLFAVRAAAAALLPARAPNTKASVMALPDRRVAPLAPPTASPAANRFGTRGLKARVHLHAAHVIMRDRRDFDRLPGQIDAVFCQRVDHRPEIAAQFGFRHVLEAQIGAARRTAAPGFDLFEDGIGREIAGQNIGAVVAAAGRRVILLEFLHLAVEQNAAELVAERIPHDRIEADEPRRQMPDREELHEFHVDQLRAGAQRQRIAVAAHIQRGAVAPIEPRQPAGRDHHGLGRDGDGLAGLHVNGGGAAGDAVFERDVDDEEIADTADRRLALHLVPQRLRHRGSGAAGNRHRRSAAGRGPAHAPV